MIKLDDKFTIRYFPPPRAACNVTANRRGVGCELSNYCKRYLPDHPDAYMWWVQEKFQEETGRCPYFDENYKD